MEESKKKISSNSLGYQALFFCDQENDDQSDKIKIAFSLNEG
jgi:hypothetical protein